MQHLRPWLAGCVVISSLLVGCKGNSNPATYPVTGVVTFNGQPLADVIVTFFPANGRPSSGMTDAAGKFTLSTFEPGDGALPGACKVTILEPAPKMADGDYSIPKPKPPRFPVKYTDQTQTDLTAEVKSGGDNNFTFDLKG